MRKHRGLITNIKFGKCPLCGKPTVFLGPENHGVPIKNIVGESNIKNITGVTQVDQRCGYNTLDDIRYRHWWKCPDCRCVGFDQYRLLDQQVYHFGNGGDRDSFIYADEDDKFIIIPVTADRDTYASILSDDIGEEFEYVDCDEIKYENLI